MSLVVVIDIFNAYYESIVQKTLKGLIEENFKQHLEFVDRNPILFGDFRTALEEAEPRLYEDVQDYEATKAVFQEVTHI